MNRRYWARVHRDGTASVHDPQSVGPYFFGNAREDGDQVVVVVLHEVPMTPEEKAKVNGCCTTCGQRLPVGKSRE